MPQNRNSRGMAPNAPKGRLTEAKEFVDSLRVEGMEEGFNEDENYDVWLVITALNAITEQLRSAQVSYNTQATTLKLSNKFKVGGSESGGIIKSMADLEPRMKYLSRLRHGLWDYRKQVIQESGLSAEDGAAPVALEEISEGAPSEEEPEEAAASA